VSALGLGGAQKDRGYVLGRPGPWVDFDARLDQRAANAERWNRSEVYFAGVLSISGMRCTARPP
jgi:hypothetical protein